MTVPSAFKTAIQSKNVSLLRWIEIEGIPYAYGSAVQAAGFFSARSAAQQFLGIRAQLASIPRNLDQTVDTLEGGALTVGSTDFEISDDDGEPMKWTGVGRDGGLSLNGEHSAAATTLTFFGDATAYSNGQTIYIGTETITIGTKTGQTFTGCTRAKYRSKAQILASGLPISDRPYVMAKRRVWYNEVAVAVNSTGTQTALSSQDPNRCVRFAGTCKGFRLKDGSYGTFVLTVESLDRELDRPAFRSIRSFKLVSDSIKDGDGKNGECQVLGWPGFAGPEDDKIYNFDGLLFTLGVVVLMRIDNEIFALEETTAAGAAIPKIKMQARSLLGTRPDKHENGAHFQEVIPIIERSTATGARWEQQASQFQSAATTNAPLPADHPLMIVLQILLSTGLGTNTAGGGTRNYDVLPDDWGMGVDYDRVDIAAIEAAAMEEPTLRFAGLIDAPTNFLDLMRQLLRIAGYYYIITVGDKFTIRRLRPPLPDVPSTALGQSSRIRKFYSAWDANWTGAIKTLVFKYGWDIVNQKYKNITIVEIDQAEIYTKGLARTLEFESHFLYRGGTGVPGELLNLPFDVDQWILSRKDFYNTRYGRPPPIIRERVDYSYIDSEIGDIVSVTHPSLPEASTGARGMTASVGEIISKSIDEVSKTIEFSIIMTGWKLGSYRFIAPCIDISGYDADTIFYADDNRFTQEIGAFSGQTQHDGSLETSSSTMRPSFPVDFPVWVWTPDYKTKQAGRIGAITVASATQIQFILLPYPSLSEADWVADFTGTGTGGNIPQAGCHITHRDYDTTDTDDPETNEVILAVYAFGADSSDKLGAANLANAHKYFPL